MIHEEMRTGIATGETNKTSQRWHRNDYNINTEKELELLIKIS